MSVANYEAMRDKLMIRDEGTEELEYEEEEESEEEIEGPD